MDTISKLLEQELKASIHTHLQPHLPALMNQVTERVDALISQIVEEKFRSVDLPDGFLPMSKIDTKDFKLSVNDIVDMPVPERVDFAGIQDMANNVELTLMDGNVVVENSLVVDTVEANTLIAKDIATDQPWYNNLKREILEAVPTPPAPPKPKDWSWEIAEVDAKIDVALKKQGEIKELEVYGEALLSDVLYTTPGNRRVGINTMDPSDALTVWDNEVEVVVGKHKAQEGYIGTRRRQDLNLGANNKVGACIRSDGSVAIEKLELMKRTISQSANVPGHSAKQGDIVLNSKPAVGKYLGWVCLDGIKWAGFGKIE